MNVTELNGPAGFQHMESAPRDGTFVRLRFRPSVWLTADHEVVAQWQAHEEMKVGGWWFDREGYYVTPGPLFWAPISPIMEQAARAAMKVRTWSPAKRAYARRATQ